MKPVYLKEFGYYIVVRKIRQDRDYVELLEWRGYTLEQLSRWRWYFEYRYALMRVKYPKFHIDHNTLSYDINPKKEMQVLKNQILGSKRKLSQYTNALARAKETWNQLFPIEQDPFYPKVIEKIEHHRKTLEEREARYNELESQTV